MSGYELVRLDLGGYVVVRCYSGSDRVDALIDEAVAFSPQRSPSRTKGTTTRLARGPRERSAQM